MAVSNTNLLELLGKQVSFSCLDPLCQLVKKGIVTSIVINLSSSSEIRIDHEGDFYLLSEIIDFEVAQ